MLIRGREWNGRSPVRLIGLTGGIGTGKSAVAGHLRELGVTVIDADEGTRAVQAPGTEGLRRLVAAFGPEILTSEGALDRARLGAAVFADAEARRRLNAIAHPLVRDWMAERLREAAERGDEMVVMDIPLLFETRGPEEFDAVILVYATEELQLRRLVEQRGMDEQAARDRIAAQMPIDDKRRLASHVIVNTSTLEDLRHQVERTWAEVVAGSNEEA
ncbi:MAG: dephospho-CoA kinase [Candidatus Nephthysia bennettiae]|uniref:Dephospho-CoA kinase n=1 Tax=Candidatus Nephthysia bennettiae TaxID=3127016 RepID=A0A934NBB7_9BACT|nr:dephospho-CoA kinase [Candidatus Dormibacteraeota bacterium]MBJ7612244.1 dephospho-CoA kinase [Candidatus Dormibacteraeota bacterium]PZR88013.1 MAG: dephospho-CoA kinase [Candidatus Dormibacteraeota bacterium]